MTRVPGDDNVPAIQTAADGQPDPIDPRAWGDLRALGGEEADAMVDELIDMYLEDGATLVAAILREHRAGQTEALARSAHALRSPSATLGALGLATHCRRVEEGCAAEGLPEESRIAELVAEAERVFRALRGRRSRP